MAGLTVHLSYEDLTKLFGDGDTKVELSRQVIQSFAEHNLRSLMNEAIYKEVSVELVKRVNEQVEAILIQGHDGFGRPAISGYWKDRIRDEIGNRVAAALDAKNPNAFGKIEDRLMKLFEDKLKEVDKGVEAYINKRLEEDIEERVNKRVAERLTKALALAATK